MTRLMTALLGLSVAAACTFEAPTAPTPQGTTVSIDIDNTADGGRGVGNGTGGDGGEGGTGGDGNPGDDGGDGVPTGPASITESGMNNDGAVIFQIGPGQTFVRTGGDAATVWCRPATDCNGEGGNRTPRNTASPP